MSKNETDLNKIAERIHFEWDEALKNNDIERLLSLYAPDVVVESPVVVHLFGGDSGIVRGHKELRHLLELVAARKPPVRKHYKNKFFTDGKTLMWEYPRLTPDGEQIDFVEVMELNNGLIQYHRVYWGWYGLNVLNNDQYHRSNQ
jgi:hypothetical protein